MSTPRKLTDEQVREIRAQYLSGRVTCYELARAYGVNYSTVYKKVQPVATYRADGCLKRRLAVAS
jgi:transposase-like protein